MAPKKALRPPSPEPEEEAEEEETSGQESEEGEEEESDVEENEKTTAIQPSQVNKKQVVQKQTTAPPPAPQSSQSEGEEEGSGSEEEEEEESDSPPSPNVLDFTIKPISQTKRSSDTQRDDQKDSRNVKKVKTNEGEEKKGKGSAVSISGGVGRLWSEEDQIALLQGMIDYQNKNGADPQNDKDAFHEFIKRKLQADISKNQLFEKVRRLKKKYLANVEKAECVEDLVFSKPHESKAFDLSKKIWGSGDRKKDGKIGSINGIAKESEKDDLVGDDMSDDDWDFQSKYPYLSQSFDVDGSSFLPSHVISSVKKNLGLIDSVKAREWEEKWKKIRWQEAELFLKRSNLMAEQTQLVLNAGKKERRDI